VPLPEDPLPGRGASWNPPNRFEALHYEPDPDTAEEERPALRTQFFRDVSRSIISYNDSPDVGFSASVNPYRGCEHGCIYCYARPTHEYLGLSAGLDFESKIFVKLEAPELLRRELSAPAWQPQPLAFSGVTDCYQPIERQLQLTRRCLEVLCDFRNPVVVVTKNRLVARDRDLLGVLAGHQAAAVFLSVTTLDGALARRLEPRATAPPGRLEAIHLLAEAGIPVGVLVAPLIPGLTEHEIPAILEAAAAAGARFAGYTLLRLPHGLPTLFSDWLERHYPESKHKILQRLRDLRGGRLNDPRFGRRMSGRGPLAEAIAQLFSLACRRVGLAEQAPPLSTAAFRVPGKSTKTLFDLL
jgi:DNA repair photolyase